MSATGARSGSSGSSRPPARSARASRTPAITMAHGAGGKATQTLIEGLLAPAFGMTELDDAGVAGDVLVTTDSFVVKPLRFPGGSIGELAVNGTVNDLAVAGARPLAITVAMILEEGLDSDVLRAEVEAIAQAARAAGVEVVAGDTKVVERGHADGMYLATTGVGAPRPARAAEPAGPAARRPRAAVRLDRRARHGDHARARRVRARGRGRVRHPQPVAGRRRAARRRGRRPALHARRDARRRRLGAQRAGARQRRRDDRERDGRARRPGRGRRGGDPGDRPHVRGQRGQARRLRRAGEGGRGPGRAARGARAASAPPRSARCARSRPGWCWWRRASADGGSWTSWWGTRCRGSVERSRAMPVEFAPTAARDGGDHRTRDLDDHGAQLRRRFGRHDLGDQPEPRGHHHRRDPRHAEGDRPQPGARLRAGRGVHAGLVRRRGRQARPVRADPRGLAAQREALRRRLLRRDGRQPRDGAADHDHRVDRPARAEGGRGRGRRHLRHLRRHPGDEEQPDRARWACGTTSATTGSPRAASRS